MHIRLTRWATGVADADTMAIDHAVNRLPLVLQVVVLQIYKHGAGTADEHHATALGISKKTLAQYTNAAHRQIALALTGGVLENDFRLRP